MASHDECLAAFDKIVKGYCSQDTLGEDAKLLQLVDAVVAGKPPPEGGASTDVVVRPLTLSQVRASGRWLAGWRTVCAVVVPKSATF